MSTFQPRSKNWRPSASNCCGQLVKPWRRTSDCSTRRPCVYKRGPQSGVELGPARPCRGAGVGITLEAAVCLGSAPINDFGTKEQKERWLPDLLSGRKLWSFGLTEPEAGSDAGATKTRAEARDGSWVVNGAKQFITNCGTEISAGVTITAVTGRNGDGPEISALLVPTGPPGYHVLESYRKLRGHSSDTHPLSFEDCEVPGENLLGERGGGYRQFPPTLTGGRIAIAALSVGLAQACLDAALAYAKDRQAFG